MSVTPRVSLVAYEDRPGGFIFVAVPNERGRYLRTDRSVALVACPNCRAVAGEPCRGYYRNAEGYGALTHAARRTLAQRSHGPRLVVYGDILEPVAPPVQLLDGKISLIEPRPFGQKGIAP